MIVIVIDGMPSEFIIGLKVGNKFAHLAFTAADGAVKQQ